MPAEPGGFYDRLWAARPETLNEDERARLAEILRLVAEAGPPDGPILEVGCGTGWLSAVLSAHGTVRGVDSSPGAIAEARRRHPGIVFEAIGEEEDLGDSLYALAVSSEVLEHVADPGLFLRRIHRALRPGGRLVLTTPNRDARPWWEAMGPELQPREDWLAPAALAAAARGAGFEVAAVRSFFTRFTARGRYRLLRLPGLGRLGLRAPLERLAERSGWGLYLSLLARRPA